MEFTQRLLEGRLIRRYKRFLADVELADGEIVTCHCPNTGSMLGCDHAGLRVWLSRTDKPGRKYPLTWEIVEAAEGAMVGVHTGRANALVREALSARVIPALSGYRSCRSEVKVENEPMRCDFLLEGHPSGAACYLEVKNVTAAVETGVAIFPDAVSTRGTRHLLTLERIVKRGLRGVLVFCVQRSDAGEVRPADRIDPAYGRALREALAAGVDVFALRAHVTPQSITLRDFIPVVCP